MHRLQESRICRSRQKHSPECAARGLVPTRGPVLFLTRVAAVPSGLTLRADFELLQKALNLAPLIVAILIPLQRRSTKCLEQINSILTRLSQPVYHAGQDIRGDVVPLHDPSRRGNSGSLPHVPNLAGVGLVSVHAKGEFRARVDEAVLGGLAQPLHRVPLAARDAVA